MIKTPLLLVNFKAYAEGTGRKAVKIAETCKLVSQAEKITIAVAPCFLDIAEIVKLRLPVFAQHIDAVEPGAHTGHVTAEAIKQTGCVGTLINHSERRMSLKEIKRCVEIARKNKLLTVCCVPSTSMAMQIAEFDPDFIAYEPPELIGSSISVSKAKPEIITQVVKTVKKINPEIKILCGAGITNHEDCKTAIKLGAVGVLVASGVVKSKNKDKIITELVRGLKMNPVVKKV